MKLLNKTLELENDKFKIIKFDKERYEKNNRAHLYYLIQCKRCGEIFSRKKECIHSCKMCNIMKNKFSKEDFINKIKLIYNNYIKSSTTISKESTSEANVDGKGELLTAA